MGYSFLHLITERIRIWRRIVLHGWWKLVWGIYFGISIFSIVRVEILPQGNIPPFIEFLPRWPWWVWVLIGMGILCVAVLEGAYRQIRQATPRGNWIDGYQTRYGKLPQVPDYLEDVVQGYFPGMLVSKDIQLINPSAQFWNRLLPSQQDRLLGLVEWLGQDPRDYVAEMQRRLPPGSSRIQFF